MNLINYKIDMLTHLNKKIVEILKKKTSHIDMNDLKKI